MSFPRSERLAVRLIPATMVVVCLAAFAQDPGQKTSAHKHSAGSSKIRDRLLSLDLKSKAPPALAADVVVEKMMATSARRSQELQGYSVTRSYQLQYHGFLGARDAGMKVISTFTAPDKLEFSVVSQTGSKLLLNRVLLKLLESEREAFKDQSKIELSPANYTFESEGLERLTGDDPCYVLNVAPRKENKFLYKGKVWIDAHDFALAHMEAQPVKSPSFWLRDTQIDSTWRSVGGFWLIEHSRSVSHIRLGGMATLTIDYSDYQIKTAGRHAPGGGQNPQLPNPSAVTPQR